MFEDIQSFFTTRPKRPTSSLGAGASAEDDPIMPAFQKAWKDGALVEDMFGPSPFTLHGSIGRSGADNFRPDIAKVETFLGDAGYYKPLTGDGPSGWHNSNLDQAIRTFQKDKGLEVDGFLKPGGPTIGKIGSLLGGGAQGQDASNPGTQPQKFWGGPKGDWPGVLLPGDEPRSPRHPGGRDPGSFESPSTFPMPKPQPPSGGPDLPGGELTPQQQLEALIRIMNGGKTPDPRPQPPVIEGRPQSTPPRFPPIGNDLPEQGGITGTLPRPHDWDRLLQGHTINQDGIDANQGYAEMLVRDSDPRQTARTLKRAIDDYGDQGRGDVADLLARFQKIDGAKAETLRRELHKASGEMLPYRLAPLGEGFREPTEEEKIAAAPKTPFGSAQGADRWAAGNMAEVLLGRGNYADAITHFRGEIGRNRAEAMPYLAAVHEIMGEKNPAQAASFATQMQKAGLAAEAEMKPETAPEPVPAPTPAPAPAPEPPKPEPAPQPQPVLPTPPATQPPESKPAPIPPQFSPTAQPNQTAPQPAKEAVKPSLPSPTNQPIDPQALYEQLGYQHDGSGDYGNAIKHPLDAIKANRASDAAIAAAQSEYGKTNPALGNGEGDAFRHALWAYKMAKDIGDDGARRFGDAHERDGQPDGERLMDLYNNAVGRELAADPRNKDRSDEEVIREAIKAGRLQTKPFNIPGPMGGGLTYPPRR
jgi:hypothetical protein